MFINMILINAKDVAEKSNNVEVSANTIVSEDRKNEILAKLKDKAKNLNAGLDPESALLGMELTVYYVERGVRLRLKMRCLCNAASVNFFI